MPNVTTVGATAMYRQSNACEVRHRLADAFWWQLPIQMVCRAAFNSSVVLCLGLGLFYSSSTATQSHSSAGTNLEFQ